MTLHRVIVLVAVAQILNCALLLSGASAQRSSRASASSTLLPLVPDTAEYVLSVDPQSLGSGITLRNLLSEFAGDQFLLQRPMASTVSRYVFAGRFARFPLWDVLAARGRFDFIAAAPDLDFLGNIGPPVAYLERLQGASPSGLFRFGVTAALRVGLVVDELIAPQRQLALVARYAERFLASEAPVWVALYVDDLNLNTAASVGVPTAPVPPGLPSTLGPVWLFVTLESLRSGVVRATADFETPVFAQGALDLLRFSFAQARAQGSSVGSPQLRVVGRRLTLRFVLPTEFVENLRR